MAQRPNLAAAAESGAIRNPAEGTDYVLMPVSALAFGERRLEAENYLTPGYLIRREIESSLSYRPVNDMAEVWQPSRLKGILVTREHGVPYLSATQVFDISPLPRKWLAPARTPDLQGRFVERGWILVTRSGNVGDAIVAYAPHFNTVISDDLLRVRPKRSDERGYLYTFLRTQFGKALVRSMRYGSLVKHLEPEHLGNIPVPVPPESVARQLSERIDAVYGLREKAFRLTERAQDRFAAELGEPPNVEDWTYAVHASQMFDGRRRLDAEYYDPAADAIVKAIQATGKPVVRLDSVIDRVFLPQRFARVYMDHGIPYVDSEDIFKLKPDVTKFIPAPAKADATKYFVKAGCLLIARSGQTYGLFGTVMIANTWHEGKIISEHIIRVVPSARGAPAGYLQVALGHPIYGRPLVRRLSFGSQIPELAPDDLAGFPVVRLGQRVERAIARDVERASEVRMEANQIEDEAVKLLEGHLNQRLGTQAEEHGRVLPRTRDDLA